MEKINKANSERDRDVIMRFLSKEIALAKRNDDIEKLKFLHKMLEDLQNEYVIEYTVVDEKNPVLDAKETVSYSIDDIKKLVSDYLNNVTGKNNTVEILGVSKAQSNGYKTWYVDDGIATKVTTEIEDSNGLKYTSTVDISDEQLKTYIIEALAQQEIQASKVIIDSKGIKVIVNNRNVTR